MKSIVLTGGTGFLGGEFIDSFHSKYRIYSIYRNEFKPISPDINWVKADIGDKDSVDSLLNQIPSKIDYLIHIGGASPNRAYVDGNFNATTVGTKNLVGLAKKLKVSHIIYMSSLSVVSGFLGPYVKSKLIAEEIIKQSGIPYTIFRPTTILGSRAKDFNRLLNYIARFPVSLVVGDGSHRVQPISAHDICQIIASTVDHQPRKNKTYDLAGRDCLTQKQFITKIAHYYHRYPVVVPAFSCLLIFISKIIESINPVFGINEERIRLQMQSVCIDPVIIESEFGIHLQSLDEIFSKIILPSR